MTDEELQAVRARWAAAAPGPWRDTDLPDGTLRVTFVPLDKNGEVDILPPAGFKAFAHYVMLPGDRENYEGDDLANARAIAAAPTDIAALLAEVARLRAVVAGAEERARLVLAAKDVWRERAVALGWQPAGEEPPS